MNRKLFIIFIFFAVLFSGCGSKKVGKKSVEQWRFISSLSDLKGSWKNKNCIYEYPFVFNNKEYLLVKFTPVDDTQRWLKFVQSNNLNLEHVKRKKNSYVKYLYGNYPCADENGIETGLKFDFNGEKIFYQLQMMIPSKILMDNKNFFKMSDDKMHLVENGTLNLHSDVFDDITSDGFIFDKVE
ncbi:MAG: hypothetical protein K6B17_04350 [Treponema sp.]|nr:hypothetical protein [Treponema sp.]